jgi:osmoprotectant transport system permease protein
MTALPLAILGDFGEGVEFLFQERPSVGGDTMIGGVGRTWDFLREHLIMSFWGTVIAALIALPVALYLGHIRRGEAIASSVSNVGRALPSLVIIALFFAFLGPGRTNVTLALVLLAIPPLFTNAYVGISQVDRDVVDAARGQGYTEWQVLTRVELPLALPLIFGGLRTAAVSVVATATIAPLGGAVSLGTPIVAPGVYGFSGQLGAAIAVAALAIVCEVAFAALQRAVTPRGLKLRNDAGLRRRVPFLSPGRKVQSA